MRVSRETYNRLLNNSITVKQNKYHNEKMIIDGIEFDSHKEGNHYVALKQLERFGVISNLQLQKEFILQEAFELKGKKYRSIKYIADFVYKKDGELVVEDVKSPATKTQVYKLKKKIMAKVYGIEIKEV